MESKVLIIQRAGLPKPYFLVESRDPRFLRIITEVAQRRYGEMGYVGFNPEFDSSFYNNSTGFLVYDPSGSRVLATCRFVEKSKDKVPIEHGTLLGGNGSQFSMFADVDARNQRIGEFNSLIVLNITAMPALLAGVANFAFANVDVGFSVYDVDEKHTGYRLKRFYDVIGFRETNQKVYFPDYKREGKPTNWQIIRMDRPDIADLVKAMESGERPFFNYKIIDQVSQPSLEAVISKMQAGLP